MSKFLFSWLMGLSFLIACSSWALTPQESTHLYDTLLGDKAFKAIEQDTVFQDSFKQYLYGLQVDDLDALKAVYASDTKNIFDYSLLLHEETFLQYWLDQKIPLSSIINLDFFAANYAQLGPPAHREGIIAEFGLISYYAKSIGDYDSNDTALALVNPFVDEAGNESTIWQERFANNPEFYTHCPSRRELEDAMFVYSKGGYVYKESKEELIQLSLKFCASWPKRK